MKKERIRQPHKKEWYNYWWGVLLLVVAIIFIIFQLISYFLNPQTRLKAEGYEVLYYGCSDAGLLDMKSLGNRENQIYDGLFSLAKNCPSAKVYYISILEPTKECHYAFNGEVIKLWYQGIGEDHQFIPEESKKIIEEDIKLDLWKMEAEMYYKHELAYGISNLTIRKRSLSSSYQKYLENGLTHDTLFSIIEHEIEGRFNCE